MTFLLSRRPSLPVPLPSDRPGPSILLNPEETCEIPPSPRSPRRPPSNDGRSPTASSSSLTSSSPSISSRRPVPLTSTASSTKVSFAPLPEVPPELKRRSSITLGVAARKNLLSGGPVRAVSDGRIVERSGGNTIYMTDEQWADYKETHFPNRTEAIDVGEIAKSSAKSLWRRVRSGSLTQEVVPKPVFLGLSAPPQSPRRGLRPTRRNTDPALGSASPPSPSVACRLDAVEEERGPRNPSPGANQVVTEHHARFAPWANKSPDSMKRRSRINADGEDSDTEGSGQDTPTPAVWTAPAQTRATRERDRAVLGFDKLALDKNFAGHFGV